MGSVTPLVLSWVMVAASLQSAQAVVFQVTNAAPNTPGGARFNNQVGVDYARRKLEAATNFIWGNLQQKNPANRKNVQQVGLIVEDISGVAYTVGNQIHLSANYVQGFSGDVKGEVTGILYHEMTHVWQWDGYGQAPGGLIEGIADYERMKAGYAPNTWVKAGQGDRWDQGYDVTAHFLDYCNSRRDGFVARLNDKLKNGYSSTFFNDLLGKSPDQLWSDYKAAYNH